MAALIEKLKSAWQRASDSNTGLLAAGIAYYAFLSFMPLLAAIVLTYGLVADVQTVAQHTARIASALPGSAADLVSDQIRAVVEDRSGTKGLGLLVALALSLFGARVAAGSVITAMNIAFDAEDARGFLKANALALSLTLGAIIAIGVVAGATAAANSIFAGALGGIASFALVGLFGMGGAWLAYRFVPNTSHVASRSALLGAMLFAAGWTAASSAFGFYAANFANYNATYGSLGAIVVLLTWLYLSAWLLLFGAHFAAACDRQGR